MVGDAMEGILYKWTNYMTGWQPRWFVLQNGVISYYDSEDDVGKGSKGSIKMSVCDIKVPPSDSTRLELIIPGEQHFYVRAVNAAERQRWLVALGSSKAGTQDRNKGLAAQRHLFHLHPDPGGVHEPRTPESDPRPPGSRKVKPVNLCLRSDAEGRRPPPSRSTDNPGQMLEINTTPEGRHRKQSAFAPPTMKGKLENAVPEEEEEENNSQEN
ncbi:unnamed protein product [Menidia menidia]|uniref:(Atlantic silverside) hypothetical protein n=1 Tax=Menidia menidia TaxID=238744 RepID=A0A8S4BX49_9TELE|nr:unnamed protein product [Menidia menidia]